MPQSNRQISTILLHLQIKSMPGFMLPQEEKFPNLFRLVIKLDIYLKKMLKYYFSVDDLERVAMLVINALYFKGDWDVQFNIDRSFFGGFYTTPNDVINVGYMKNTGNYYFTESKQLDAKLIRIPFKVHITTETNQPRLLLSVCILEQ